MDEQKDERTQDEELERYGVWVKAGPEEVMEADDEFAMSDLPIDGESSLEEIPENADTLTGDLDVEGFDDIDADLGDLSDNSFDDLSLDDDLDTGAFDSAELSLADDDDDEISFSADRLEEDDASTTSASDELHLQQLDDEESSDDDGLVSLDDLDLDVPEDEPDPFSALTVDDEDGAANEADDAIDADSDTEDIDLDDLNETLDDDFETLMPGTEEEISELSIDDFDEDDSDEQLPELEHDFTPDDQGIDILPTAPNALTPDEEEFLESADLQNDDDHDIPTGMDPHEREAFERIQTELSDIKRELAELKTALRAAAGATGATQTPIEVTAPIADERPEQVADNLVDDMLDEEPAAGPGFFDEEEDETIALTGDELDNILNTAEFTEEVGEAAEIDDDFVVDPAEVAAPTEDDAEDAPVSEIELEPVDESSVVIDGDESAIDELADMDIDQELSDIESLSDETTTDEDALGTELDLDIDDFGGIDDIEESEEVADELSLDDTEDFADELSLDEPESDDEILEEHAADAAEEAAAAADEAALSADVDEFEDFASAVEDDLASEEESITLDEDFDAPDSEEPDDIEITLDDGTEDDLEIEIDLDDYSDDDEDELDTPSENDLTIEDIDDDDEEWTPSESAPEPSHDDEAEADPVASSEPVGPSDLAEELVTHAGSSSISDLPEDLKQEIRSVLSYMDQLLEALPDDKIEEFAQSEHFDVYKRLFEELGLET